MNSVVGRQTEIRASNYRATRELLLADTARPAVQVVVVLQLRTVLYVRLTHGDDRK